MIISRQMAFVTTLLACSSLVLDAQDRRGPFTNAPRSVRSRDIDQQHLRLELHFDWEKQELTGRAVHQLTPFKPIREVNLDASDMKIHRVELTAEGTNSNKLKFSSKKNSLSIQLGREFKPEEKIELTIDYTVTKPQLGAHFVIPDESEPNQPKMVWTQCEPEYARYWFPCIDSPTDRLTSEILATVPDSFYVLSNGKLQGTMKNSDGTQTWHWIQKKSHVPYLMSVVAGEFEVLQQDWQGIPVESFVPKGRLADAPRSFEKTPQMMDFFSKKIGYKYPWPKYAQICVDEYNWGGMEHTSATTLNVSTLHDKRAHLDTSSDNLVAHELAHQWFGDLMTCKDWAELWLNESFATYFATLWTEHDLGWDEATWKRSEEAQRYMSEDKRYRRPIVTYRYNSPGNMFDSHSYPKGARVLHMLRFELGDEGFWKAINRYTTINQFRTVETADFRIAVEEATGQSVTWFFDQWLYHGGHPDFDVSWSWDEKSKQVRLVVKQTQKVDDMTPLFRSSVEIELATPAKTEIRRISVSKAEETFNFQLNRRPSRVCFDPQDWILKTLNFSKGKEEWLDQLGNDSHVVCRVRAARELAELNKHDDVREALLNTAQKDEFWAVRQEAAEALGKFKGDAVRKSLIKVAKTDEKSLVRRAALKSLTHFSHDDTRNTLRHIISQDESYYAVAEALKGLVKVDRENCKQELLAALDTDSHREVILKAAADGLVQLKSSHAETRLQEMLGESITPQQRVAVIGALAKLKPDDSDAVELLVKQLENDRRRVREVAIESLVDIGGATAIDALQTRRGKEHSIRIVQKIDEAIDKIHEKDRDVEKLRSEVEKLRKQNRQMEDRLKQLEKLLK